MKLSEIRPISYLKARAPEILANIAKRRTPVVITSRGKASAVLQDIASYEETQETLALLKILALTNKQVETGQTTPAREAFARVRGSVKS